MELGDINYLAIVVAALASFIFGFGYYASLGKFWMAATGKSEEELKSGGMAQPMIITIICQLIMSFFLAGIMVHVGEEHINLRGGLINGFFVWVGFAMTATAVNYAWQRAKVSLMVIDGGHWLGVLLVQGAVLGVMGV
ncbi:MAG: hypothetical protein CMM52_01590 [Rhodospirillaceae bacterium]|nr:hypothetical protein [Rhodospirillaceae bacterium]|tara:strand:+ start:7390 stop:7803 length:414 start_codon:yes stop_codon:yes gene_type:complete